MKTKIKNTSKRITSGVLSVLMATSALAAVGTVAANAGTMTNVVTWSSSTSVSAGTTLSNNTLYKVMSDKTITGSTGGNALAVASGATATLYIPSGVTLTVTGGAGSGTTGGGAGIFVPSNSTLIVTGGGTLNATGGNAGSGSSGSSNQKTAYFASSAPYYYSGAGGAGGAGGGGAGAGIGTSGGTGGSGGSGASNVAAGAGGSSGGVSGKRGTDGNGGSNALSSGKLYVLGNVTVNAIGGSEGSAGSSGSLYTSYQTDDSRNSYNYAIYYSISFILIKGVAGGGGCGGGGGGGYSAANIGNGGSGGSGGGGGGSGAAYQGKINTGVSGWTSLAPGGGGGGAGGNTGLQGYGPDTSSSDTTSYKTGNSISSYSGGSGGSGGISSINSSSGYVYAAPTATVSTITNTYEDTGKGASMSTASSNTAVDYTVTLESSASSETKTVTIGIKQDEITIPTREGYIFEGYYTSENGEGIKLFDANGNPVKGTDYIDEDGNWIYPDDVTLYAFWVLSPEGDPVHSEIVYGIIDVDTPEEYFYGNVNVLSDGAPANADSVTLVSGETELSLSPSATGTYDYTAMQSGTTYEVYVNGENTGETLTINSTDSANPSAVEVNLYSVEVSVTKNGAPLSNADIAIKSGSKTRMLPESSTQSGTYSLRSLASSTDYVVYLDGEETSETVMFASTGNTAEIELFETTVRTLINDTLTDSMGNITLVNGDNVINTEMTSTGIFKAETDEGVTYDVYLNGKDTGTDVVSGKSADVVYNSTFVTFTKDGEAFDSNRTVEITNGTEKFELAPYNSSNNTYTVNLLSNDSTVYNVLVDGKDTGYTVTANTTTTVNYLTTTVKVTKDGVAYDADRTVTIKNDTETIKPQPIDGSKNTYTTLMLETNTSEYDVLIDGNQTNISVSAGKTATVNYSSLVAQLRKDGTVYDPDCEITFEKGLDKNYAEKIGEGKYAIISLESDDTTYDVFVDGEDSKIDVTRGVTAFIDYTTLKVNVNKDNAPFSVEGGITLVNGDYLLTPALSETGVYEIVQPNTNTMVYNVCINGEDIGKTISVDNSTADVNYYTLTLNKNVDDSAECIVYPSEQIVQLEGTQFNMNNASCNLVGDDTQRFVGWFTEADAGTKVETFTFSKTDTLYARYDNTRNYVINYNVLSDSDFASYTTYISETKSGKVSDAIVIPDYLNEGPCLSNEHYVASAKATTYTTATGGTTETPQAIADDDSLVINVYYDLDSYDVSYKVNGSADSSVKAYYGQEITVAAPNDSDYEYKFFSGWTDDDSNTYNVGDKLTVTKPITLNGTLETSSIVYKLNEGIFDGKPDDVTVNDLLLDHKYDMIAPTREEYELTGWKDANGNVYAPDEKFTVTQQNTTLTAQWKHVDHHYKTPVWRWYRKSAKDNYEASLSTECTVCGLIEKDVNANVTYQDNADGTVTAIAKAVLGSNEWTSEYVFVAGYTVTVENGFINQGAKSSYALGDVVSIYAQPKNSNGENFAGWYVDDGDNNRDNDQLLSNQNLFAVYVSGNIKIYARYEAEPEVSPLAFSVQGGIRKRIAGQNKTTCSFTVRWDLSDKVNGNVYRLVDAGVLRSYTVSGENLNLNSVDNNIVRKHSSSKISNLGTFTYTLNMSAATSAKSYNVRGFAVYKNVTSGEKIVVYSDTVHNDPFVF